MRNFLFITCIAFIAISCKKSDVKNTSVVGSWEMINQKSGANTTTFTRGKGNVLQINADSTYKVTSNFQTTATGRFSISTDNKMTWEGKTYTALYFHTVQSYNWDPNYFFLNNNSLTITDRYGSVSSVFVR